MSMRKIYFLFAFCCFTVLMSNAQETIDSNVKERSHKTRVHRNPMTFNASLHSGMAIVANHYMSTNAYKGLIYGAHVDFGRFYKSSKNVSWNLSFDSYSSENVVDALVNDAKTSSMGYKALNLDYTLFYNWMSGKGLMFKFGGGFDISGDLIKNLTHQTNNAASVNAIAQLQVSTGISYTFKFKKWMLGLYGNVSAPFAGMIFTDAKHESGAGSLFHDDLMDNYYSHIRGTSISNLQWVDLDFGVKFIAPRVAIDLGFVSENHYWYVNEIQNRRTNILVRLGASFNLVSLEQTKTVNRYF